MLDRDEEHRRHVERIRSARERARQAHARAARLHRAAAELFAEHASHMRERGNLEAAMRADALALHEKGLAETESRRASE